MLKRIFYILFLVVFFFSLVQCSPENLHTHKHRQMTIGSLPAPIRPAVEKKLSLFFALAKKSPVTNQLIQANKQNSSLSSRDIKHIDKLWQSSKKLSPLEKKILNNRCSQLLRAFQDKYPGFSEIFISDMRGLVVCMTNKTSDYYQADEAWWSQITNRLKKTMQIGCTTYDESSRSVAMPLYVVITNEKGQWIGIGKALFAIESLKQNL